MSNLPNVQVNASFTDIDQYYVLPPTHTLTHDTEARGHIISDEQLVQMANGGRDISLDLALGSLGIAAGFGQNLAFAVGRINADRLPTVWDVIGSAVFFVSATISIVTFLYYLRNRRQVSAIVDEIRNRRVGLMVTAGGPYAGGKPFIGEGEATDSY